MSMDEMYHEVRSVAKREELKHTFYETLRPLVKRTAIQYAEARLPSQDCIEDLIISLGKAMETAANEMQKGAHDVPTSM